MYITGKNHKHTTTVLYNELSGLNLIPHVLVYFWYSTLLALSQLGPFLEGDVNIGIGLSILFIHFGIGVSILLLIYFEIEVSILLIYF